MLDILVVHPPYLANKEIVYLPLGLGYMAAIAEREGHTVSVLDMHNLRIPFGKLETELKKKEYHAVLMGGFAMQVKSMQIATKIVKETQPNCQVMLGGVGVSDIPEIVLQYTKADAVSIGEAELTLPSVLRSIEENRPYEGTVGFVTRHGGEFVKRPKGPVPEDLDSLPFPAYHLFDLEFISQHSYNGMGERSTHVMTSRGCPFRCSFCINSVLNDRNLLREIHGEVAEQAPTAQRFRSTANLIEEIEYLRTKYGITDFHFADEEFITNRRRLEEVCSAVEPLGITWSTSGRADWATEDKLLRMKQAGCQYILFGVESGSQTMLDHMTKHAKIDAVSQGLSNARKVNMNFIANFMIGHPGETVSTVNETVEFCKEHNLIFLPAYVTLFPNSKMFHDFAKKVKNWDNYFAKLSKIDFTRRLFLNLTELSDRRLVLLRSWGVAETFSFALAPKLIPIFRPLLILTLRLGLLAMDYSPAPLRWMIRNLVRRKFDHKPGKNGDEGDSPQSLQRLPNDLGQSNSVTTVDTYEESLAQLQKQS